MRKAHITFAGSIALAGALCFSLMSGCSITTYSPPTQQLNEVPTENKDEMLMILEDQIAQLRELRNREKFGDLPGTDTFEEQKRLSKVLDSLLDRLIAGISANPGKAWVMGQFKLSLESIQMEDTEAREQFADNLEQIMDILKIESSDGLLNEFLYGM
jgi:hypothetical protein